MEVFQGFEDGRGVGKWGAVGKNQCGYQTEWVYGFQGRASVEDI
jgi:hypothetical protein